MDGPMGSWKMLIVIIISKIQIKMKMRDHLTAHLTENVMYQTYWGKYVLPVKISDQGWKYERIPRTIDGGNMVRSVLKYCMSKSQLQITL